MNINYDYDYIGYIGSLLISINLIPLNYHIYKIKKKLILIIFSIIKSIQILYQIIIKWILKISLLLMIKMTLLII